MGKVFQDKVGVIKTTMIDRYTGKDKVVEKQFERMEPVGRMGQPKEVAQAVIWLCSDAASFVTAHPMAVDGGWVAQGGFHETKK